MGKNCKPWFFGACNFGKDKNLGFVEPKIRDREVGGSNRLAPQNFDSPQVFGIFGKYLSSLNTNPISQIDFWGRNAVCPESPRIIRLLRQSPLEHNMYYQTRSDAVG